jgi:manganese transport protein
VGGYQNHRSSRQGLSHIASIEEAHLTLQPLLGAAAGWVFAISLLAAGLASTTVGTMAGQVMVQGFLRRHIPVWLRRLITIVPSLIVIFLGCDPTRTLVISLNLYLLFQTFRGA